MDFLFDKGSPDCGTIRSNRKGLQGFMIDMALSRGQSDVQSPTDEKTLAIK